MTGALTLVVFSGVGPAEGVPDVLREWSQEELLHDVLLVPIDDGADRGAPDRGVIVSRGAFSEVDVVEAVATRELSLLRLVRLRLVIDSCGPDPAVDALADRLEARLAGGHQSLLRINLVVPLRDDLPVPVEAFRVLWPVNVVVSPEDRITERHVAASVMTRPAAHAALATATAGALWSQMNEGPFDKAIPELGSSPRSVLIARSWVRVLVGGGALRHVVQGVFAIRRDQPETLARAAAGVVTRDAEVVIDRATNSFIKNAGGGVFNYVAARPLAAPQPATVSLMEALRNMVAFLWAALRRLPATVKVSTERALEGKAERAVQALTYGDESDVVTSFAGRRRGRPDRTETGDPALAVRHYAQALLSALELPEIPAATPSAWRDLRAIIFGLHDGGALPDYVDPPVSGAVREVVTAVERLAAVPSEAPLRLSDFLSAEDAHSDPVRTPLRECDPYQAEAARRWLEGRIASLAPAPIAESPVDAAGSDDTDGSGEGESRSATPRLDALRRALAAVEEWIALRAETPCWRVTTHLMKDIERANAGLEKSLAVLRNYQSPDDRDAHALALKRLRRTWSIVLALGSAAVLWWFVSGWLARTAVPVLRAVGASGNSLGWRLLSVAIVVSLLAAFWAFVRYQKEIFRLSHRRNLRMHQLEVAVRDAEHDSRQVVRLAALYEQARDWGELVAWMLHRPEGPPRPDTNDERPPAHLETPLAFTRAAGQPTPASLQRVAAQVANGRFQRGWLSQLYVTYLEHSMAALAHQRGLDPRSVRFDPDTELADPKRAELTDAVRAGTPSEIWRTEIARDARAHLARTDPEDVFPHVVHLDDSQPGKVVPAREFLHDIVPSDGAAQGALPLLATFWNRSAVFSDRHRVMAVHAWLPESAQLPTGSGVVRHGIAISPRDDDGFMLQAIRVDVAGPVQWADVATPTRDTPTIEPEWAMPPPEDVAL